ncbi:MAG: PadR family transcriptional regulator [Candidatus Polarisedimenticolia bacterium]
MTDTGSGTPIDRWEIQLRKGSLDLAILACLWSGRLYGLEILRRLADGSGLVVPEGTVYPLLSRMKSEGWVDSEWVEAEAGHPRKYYRLTPSGRRHVRRMALAWSRFSASLDHLVAHITKDKESTDA